MFVVCGLCEQAENPDYAKTPQVHPCRLHATHGIKNRGRLLSAGVPDGEPYCLKRLLVSAVNLFRRFDNTCGVFQQQEAKEAAARNQACFAIHCIYVNRFAVRIFFD